MYFSGTDTSRSPHRQVTTSKCIKTNREFQLHNQTRSLLRAGVQNSSSVDIFIYCCRRPARFLALRRLFYVHMTPPLCLRAQVGSSTYSIRSDAGCSQRYNLQAFVLSLNSISRVFSQPSTANNNGRKTILLRNKYNCCTGVLMRYSSSTPVPVLLYSSMYRCNNHRSMTDLVGLSLWGGAVDLARLYPRFFRNTLVESRDKRNKCLPVSSS